MNHSLLQLFCLNASRDFGHKVSQQLRIPLSSHEEREFEDGEHKARPLVEVRNHHTFVIHSLYSEANLSANDKLCQLLFFIATLKESGAASVTALIPYLCYSRKDRKTNPFDPVTSRYVAHLFEAMGCDRLITIDVHNLAAFENAFRCPTENLSAQELFVQYFASFLSQEDIILVSPDIGGSKRVESFRQSLSQQLRRPLKTAFVEKYRHGKSLSGEQIVGTVKGHVALIVDDLISSGKTLARAALSCRCAGASKVYAVASHGVFHSDAAQLLNIPEIEEIIITNTVDPWRLPESFIKEKLVILDASSLIAESIRSWHTIPGAL